jgi:peptidoglycan/LPS O-acetylase OafA/YrhL
MLYHFHLLWLEAPHARWLEKPFSYPPLKFLIAGHGAVIVFFLLSGFVLALPQIRGKKTGYATYLVKRICRIYLPYLVALAFAVAGCWIFHGLTAYGYWFHFTWHKAPSWRLVLDHVLFIGDYDVAAYNTAFWSLVQEMRISLIFPFVCAGVLRRRRAVGVIGAILLSVIAGLVEHFTHIPQMVVQTVSYLGIFILGITAARSRGEMVAWLEKTSVTKSWMFFLGSVFFFFYASSVSAALRTGDTGTDILTAVSGMGLIFYSLGDRRVSALLLGRVPRFFGRISYSLYLLHGTVLFLLVYMTYGRLPLMAILVPYLVITTVLATAMYQVVEVRSINLGHAIAGRLTRERESLAKPV